MSNLSLTFIFFLGFLTGLLILIIAFVAGKLNAGAANLLSSTVCSF